MLVETAAGTVRGSTDGGVHSFLGVPYARADRFEPPEPSTWSGVRDALAFGPACPQTDHVVTPEMAAILDRYELPHQDEDCLHLNVWTPSAATPGPGASLPVLVWIHGGNFTWGSSADPLTWGDRLAARGDAVVVSVNHRVGVLGFLGPDNLGMLDLVASLEWVRDNIAAFGGDPDRVTIFGMSSGGMKVAALMAMPSARGLFHRVISQSGPGRLGVTAEAAADVRERFLARLGGADPRTVPVGKLLQAQDDVVNLSPVDVGVQLGPVVDGVVLPVHPVDARPEVPLLIGTNRDELALMLVGDPRYASYGGATSDADVVELLGRLTPEPDRLLSAFREARPRAGGPELLGAVLSDRMRVSAIGLAEREADAPAFMYLFAFPCPVDPRLGAFHGLEVPFVFDCVDRSPMTGGGADARAVAAAMSDAWVRFAATGDPGWPAYTSADRPTMVFDVEPHVELDPGATERQAITDLGLAW